MNAQAEDTYQAPAHGWTCFHCGETFMHERAARDHFGPTPDHEPGCALKLLSEDRSLLRALRASQAEVRQLRHDLNEEISSTTAYYSQLQSQLRGFKPFRECRSIQDAFNVYDSMEGRALAAEERLSINGSPVRSEGK